ncbi:MAG: hypothetical protein K8J08_22075 [Thermoanaerobaculia bacterium]|nr:hypothetical protein [Thermoanaerobaculia bacterium]
MMVWGSIYWTVLPFGYQVMHGTSQEAAVKAILARSLPGTGVYMVPWLNQEQMAEPGAAESLMAEHRQGPLVQIFYTAEGADPMGPSVFLGGFINMFTSALIVAALLCMAMPGLPTFSLRAQFVFLVGLFAGVAVDLARPIWWHQPWNYWIHQALFPITGWLLVGLVMAAIVKDQPPAEDAA